MHLFHAVEPLGDCEFSGQAVQLQCLAVVEPLGDCELAGQAVQMADPGLVYVLEPQISQCPSFGPTT